MGHAGKLTLNGLANGGVQALSQLIGRVRPARGDDDADGDVRRWRAVTVNKPIDDVRPEELEPLARLADMVEIVTRPAPGDKGTEIAARLREPEPSGLESHAARLSGEDPRQAVRTALRQAKQLLETGEILERNENDTTKETLRGKPIDLAEARSGGEGRL